MISKNLEKSLHSVFVDARKKGHEFVSVEHLFLALLDDQDAVPVLIACNANIDELRAWSTDFIDENTPKFPPDEEPDSQPTLGFQRVIQRAIMHVQAKDGSKGAVTGANCLLAIFGEKDSHAVFWLGKQGIGRLDVVNYLATGIQKKPPSINQESKVITRFSTRDSRSGIAAEKGGGSGSAGELKPIPDKLQLFISYSHLDAACLTRLLVHLRPLERNSVINCWSDKKIRSGDKWRDELQKNLQSAAVAVLMVSADFLASDFIINNELPPLLSKSEAQGLRIIPVVLSHCGFSRDQTLRNFQSINDPASPLLGMAMIDQEFLYDKIASEIYDEFQLRSST